MKVIAIKVVSVVVMVIVAVAASYAIIYGHVMPQHTTTTAFISSVTQIINKKIISIHFISPENNGGDNFSIIYFKSIVAIMNKSGIYVHTSDKGIELY